MTTYDYRETDELTTYEEDAKLLTKVKNIWIPATETVSGDKPILHTRPIYASADCIINEQHVKKGDVIGYKPTYLNPEDTTSGFNPEVWGVEYTNEWLVEKEYMPLSGFGNNDDPTISFGNKILIDQYDNPYSAYYSQYTEEGEYTSDKKEYEKGDYDYYYKLTKQGIKPKTDFEGGKYF